MANQVKKVKEERTGWRDEGLDQLCTSYGLGFSGIALNGLFLEYDSGKPMALMEYRTERSPWLMECHPALQSVRNLADRGGVPFFIARHSDDFTEYQITPLNSLAESLVPESQTITEEAFVRLLYKVRGRAVEQDTLDGLRAPAEPGTTISQRHRLYGWNAPCVDIDTLCMSWDSSTPSCMVEFKNERARPVPNHHPTVRATRALADAAGLPFFTVRYTTDHIEWVVRPMNAIAREMEWEKHRAMSQAEFFAFMRWLGSPSLDRKTVQNQARRI